MLSFHLAAPPDGALAQRVQLALGLHGAALCLRPADGAARLTVVCAGQGKLVLRDGIAMLDLIWRLFGARLPTDPAQRAAQRDLLEQVVLAEERLAAVMVARDARDLDLAVYHLRETLKRIGKGLGGLTPAAGLERTDVALAPLLWRLQVLDGGFGSQLGAGLPVLRVHAARLLAVPQVADLLDRAAAARLVARVRDSGAALADAEVWTVWDRAFAPRKMENKVLFAGARTKVPSIGRSGAFR